MTPSGAGQHDLGGLAGRPWLVANELLAFLLELAALGALCWWGSSVGSGLALHLLLGLGTPALAAVLWGWFAAPRARVKLPLAGVLAVKTLVLGGGALAVYGVGHPAAAIVFAVVLLVNTALVETYRRKLPRPV